MRKGTSMVDATSPAGDVAGKRSFFVYPDEQNSFNGGIFLHEINGEDTAYQCGVHFIKVEANIKKWQESIKDETLLGKEFYLEGLHASCSVTNFMEMDDVVFVTQDRKGLDYEKGDKYG